MEAMEQIAKIPFGQAARELAALGAPVFPCSPGDKRPLTDRGFYDATTDLGEIAIWGDVHPDAMVGLPTGHATGVFVIDVDPAEDEGASAVLARLEDAMGERLPQAPTVRTPRRGLHLYFAMPEETEIRNRANVIPGVDIRGEGGFVVFPPSVRADGVAYAWLRKMARPPQASAAMIEMFKPRN